MLLLIAYISKMPYINQSMDMYTSGYYYGSTSGGDKDKEYPGKCNFVACLNFL